MDLAGYLLSFLLGIGAAIAARGQQRPPATTRVVTLESTDVAAALRSRS